MAETSSGGRSSKFIGCGALMTLEYSFVLRPQELLEKRRGVIPLYQDSLFGLYTQLDSGGISRNDSVEKGDGKRRLGAILDGESLGQRYGVTATTVSNDLSSNTFSSSSTLIDQTPPPLFPILSARLLIHHDGCRDVSHEL